MSRSVVSLIIISILSFLYISIAYAYSSEVELNTKQYYQSTVYTCGPAAVMILLNFYGRLSSSDMNSQTELKIANEMDASPGIGGGTTSDQVANWLTRHGFHVQEGDVVSASLLADSISQGHPVMVSYDGHWLIAKGFITDSDSTDPQVFIFTDSVEGTTTISARSIDLLWGSAHLPYARFRANGEYIIATP